MSILTWKSTAPGTCRPCSFRSSPRTTTRRSASGSTCAREETERAPAAAPRAPPPAKTSETAPNRGRERHANLRLLNTVTGNITGPEAQSAARAGAGLSAPLAARGAGVDGAAAYLCEVSREVERQVGMLVNRRGEIEHVFVGDASRITLPEIGRLRAGRGRFRGPAPGAHPPAQRAAYARRSGRSGAAAAGPGGGDRGAARRAARRPSRRSPASRHYRGRPAVARAAERAVPPQPARRAGADQGAGRGVRARRHRLRSPPRGATAPCWSSSIVRRQRPGTPATPGSDIACRGQVEELRELCRTAGVRVMGVMEQRRPEADPKYLVGRGKLEEVLIRAMQLDANVLIFDPDLTPARRTPSPTSRTCGSSIARC